MFISLSGKHVSYDKKNPLVRLCIFKWEFYHHNPVDGQNHGKPC